MSSEYLSFSLHPSFLESYKDRTPDWGFPIGGGNTLGELTFLSKYARRKDDGSKERWHETCQRVIEGMYSILKDQCINNRTPWNEQKAQRSAQDAYERMFSFKWLPPGRGLWMMGTEAVNAARNSAALQNCGFVSTEKLSIHSKVEATLPFVRLMEMSMLGVGVGFDTRGAGKIMLSEPDYDRKEFRVIPDTREGWYESVGDLLWSYFSGGPCLEFDYTQIRPAGELIKGFGGVAAGPGPLIRLHDDLRRILGGRDGEKLTSSDIVDINNLIGKAVVSGNVRRSAELALGDANDDDFLNLKNYEVNPERMGVDGWGHSSNNSIAASVGGNYDHLIDRIVENGEPGLVYLDVCRQYGRLADPINNKDHRIMGVNPCAEQNLEHMELCVSGDTLVHTRYGVYPIDSLVGSNVEIWNGNTWSIVTPFSTGRNSLYRVTLSDGSYLDATPGHMWIAKKKQGHIFREFATSDLEVGMILPEFELTMSSGKAVDNAYLWGWMAGDGYVYNDIPMVLVQKSEEEALECLPGTQYPWQKPEEYSDSFCRVNVKGNIPLDVALQLRDHAAGLPDSVMSMDNESISDFLGGWIDTDGSLIKQENTDHYVLYGDEQKLRDLQVLIRRIGINHSTLRLFKPKGHVTNKGTRNQDLWRLLIPSYEAGVVATRIKVAYNIGSRYGINNAYENSQPIDRARKQKIVSVELITEDAPTYCFEEPLEHCGVFGNVLTKQCTLVESFPINHDTLDDYRKTLKVAYLYGKAVTLLPTHWPEVNEVMQRNRRIGCSVSGSAQFAEARGWTELRNWLDEGYKEIIKRDRQYSEWLGVRESIKMTSVKPSGCRPWESLTSTANGLLTLEELFIDHPDGEEWSEYNGTAIQDGTSSPITKTYDNGKSPVASVRMTYGMEVRSTYNHKWWVESRYLRNKANKYQTVQEWVSTENLRPGDILGINVGAYKQVEVEPAQLSTVNSIALKMRSDGVDIFQPRFMNDDLAWLMGYLWGDGCLSPGGFRIRFIDSNVDNLDKASSILEREFGLHSSVKPASGARKAHVLEVGSKMLWHWLIKNCFWKYDADSLELIPKPVRSSGWRTIVSFLAGLIDADGCVSKRARSQVVILSTSDERFARHVQDVALACGISFGRSHNVGGDSKQERKSMWLLTSTPESDSEAFDYMVSQSNKMAARLELPWTHNDSTHRKSRILGKVVSVDDLGIMPTFDIEVANTHWYYAGAVKSHNTVSLLAGVTPGVHWPTADIYIRRMRLSTNDPLVDALSAAGYHTEPDVMNPLFDMVVELPTKGPEVRTEREVSVWEKAALAVAHQRHWADNAVSVTLTFREDEKDQVGAVIRAFEGQLKTLSFLPSFEQGAYAQMPYERIDADTYNKKVAGVTYLDWDRLYNGESLDAVGESYCSTDVCEIKLETPNNNS